ncbi:MAG: DUF3768 domain-containing protein [Sphingomonas sp.]
MTATDGVRADDARVLKIAKLNDDLRARRSTGRLFVTPGVIRHTRGNADTLLAAIAAFDIFTADNDPYGEHDFGSIDWEGERVFWKVDYYDTELNRGSPNPADPAATTRVLTIMLASEY